MSRPSRPPTIAERLERIAERLTERGQVDLAQETASIVSALRCGENLEETQDVLTTGEAAKMLGVRSLFTVKRWAREGLLEGFQRGGRILVTRRSVERLLHSPKVSDQRAREGKLIADFDAFDAKDEVVPPAHWHGRRPWAPDESSEGRPIAT